ncbi:ABC transporter substrate-binding protein [Chthonobacter rhizosphaerae]|uniref:ABC transporter substrate-binding protein n=1 Tax=Chthonobacter rhizosphaerae TaxID=2735553 RepID=UPI0015EF83CA|nr:ABC transporter substrate-binding protein [Chthonobacter rhizosphaerae]
MPIPRRIVLGLLAGALALPVAARAAPLSEDALRTAPFETIVEAARGGTVNFFLWGGDDRINAYVSGPLAEALKAEYGITLNRVGVADTAEVVNQILSEQEAGVTDGGAVDLVWINGENFRTLKTGGLLLCGYAERLPNARFVDWSDPSIANDFGTPVDGCEVPWSKARFALAYDSARTAEPPKTMAAFLDWVRANPGRFTYAAPPDFNGSAFVRHVFMHAAGGAEALSGPFDQARFDAAAEKAYGLLDDLEPFLWREGRTYPTDIAQLNQLFANSEVDFTFNYEPTVFGAGVADGRFPETTRSFAFDDGTLANTSYVAVPFNAANKAAALVLANHLLSPAEQLRKADPAVWGMATALDLDRLTPAEAEAFRALPRHPAVIADEDLADRAMAELSADWLEAIEKGWIERVGR